MDKYQRSREMHSLQGHFLVAAPHQLDPNFVKATILVIEHTNRGSFGVIVNGTGRESSRFQQRNFTWCSPEKLRFFFGGPVTGPLMAIHTKESSGERQFLPGVFFSAQEKNVLSLMRHAERPCKIFFGYAGWGPRQLDYEVEQGIWRRGSCHARADLLRRRRSLGAAFKAGLPVAIADHVQHQAYSGRPITELK